MLISTFPLTVDPARPWRFQSLDWVDVDFDGAKDEASRTIDGVFQSLDWVDVDFDPPSPLAPVRPRWSFQSLDWVDVDFDFSSAKPSALTHCFNPSTGLMLISTCRSEQHPHDAL